MAYSVVFKVQHIGLPPDIRERARRLIEEIGETCSSMPRDAPFWQYMKESALTLSVGGWKFTYRLDRPGWQLVVYHCEKIKDVGDVPDLAPA